MTIDNMTAAEVFEGAVEVINDRGWTQGTMESADGAVCAIGAIHHALQLSPRILQELAGKSVFVEFDKDGLLEITDDTPIVFSTLPHWNDTPHRTKEEVVDKFMASAKKLRELG